MARTSNPSHYIPHVWDLGTDPYSHTDLVANWDAIDAQISRVSKYEPLLGSLTPIYLLDATFQPYVAPNGWAICDGRTLTSGQHSFPAPLSGNSISMPDLRNVSLLGASQGLSYGAAGTLGDGSSHAPGPAGVSGSNNYCLIPPHFHNHQHIHRVGGVNGVETADATGGPQIQVAQDGVFAVSRPSHTHQLLQIYSTNPRRPTNSDQRVKDAPSPDYSGTTRYMTTKQIWANPAHTVLDGSGATLDDEPSIKTGTNAQTGLTFANYDDLWVDARPRTVGVIWLMYVLKQT